jgi:hypothetical protein
VVLHRLDHHRVLGSYLRDLHAPRAAHARVRDVTIAGDLVRGVDNHDAPTVLIGQEASRLTQQGGLPDSWPTQEQYALPLGHKVTDDIKRSADGAADAAGQADDLAPTVAHSGDAVQRARNTGTIIVAERAKLRCDSSEIRGGDLHYAEVTLLFHEASRREAPEIQHHLNQDILRCMRLKVRPQMR